MLAMVLSAPRRALEPEFRAIPRPGPHQVLLKVRACAVCRTDLHVVDDELPGVRHPIVPGHEIVGEVVECGRRASQWQRGTRVGVPWLGSTCGACEDCRAGRENLCDAARFTGYHLDGGYAEYAVADARYCLRLPDALDDVHAAPLLCAGLIGYRALTHGRRRAAHRDLRLRCRRAHRRAGRPSPGPRVPTHSCAAATRRPRLRAPDSAAPGSATATERPPRRSMRRSSSRRSANWCRARWRAVRKGGTVVCGGIHMSDIPSFPYALLWGERVLRSVANLTRADGEDFLALAPQVPVRTRVTTFPLAAANEACSVCGMARCPARPCWSRALSLLVPARWRRRYPCSCATARHLIAGTRETDIMKIQVKHSLKTDVDSAFKLCTEQKSQEAIYAKLAGTDVKIKREGRAPNVKLQDLAQDAGQSAGRDPRLVPSTNEVSHTEDWAADGDGYRVEHRRRHQGRAGEDRRHQARCSPRRAAARSSGTSTSPAASRCSAASSPRLRATRSRRTSRTSSRCSRRPSSPRRICCNAASHMRNVGRPAGRTHRPWRRMSPMDQAFFLLETEQRPMNIGVLVVLAPPSGCARAFRRSTSSQAMLQCPVGPPFNYRLPTSPRARDWPALVDDAGVDPPNRCSVTSCRRGSDLQALFERICRSTSKPSRSLPPAVGGARLRRACRTVAWRSTSRRTTG